eukprot:scaffold2030_cov131-Amphora_coffeaeformis.AAC.1
MKDGKKRAKYTDEMDLAELEKHSRNILQSGDASGIWVLDNLFKATQDLSKVKRDLAAEKQAQMEVDAKIDNLRATRLSNNQVGNGFIHTWRDGFIHNRCDGFIHTCRDGLALIIVTVKVCRQTRDYVVRPVDPSGINNKAATSSPPARGLHT